MHLVDFIIRINSVFVSCDTCLRALKETTSKTFSKYGQGPNINCSTFELNFPASLNIANKTVILTASHWLKKKSCPDWRRI